MWDHAFVVESLGESLDRCNTMASRALKAEHSGIQKYRITVLYHSGLKQLNHTCQF